MYGGITLKALILGAGYAVNLYPLTENQAKPLISIADKTIVERIIEKIDKIKEIKDIYIVTNSKFYENFQSWLSNTPTRKKVTIFDDGTLTKESKLGPVRDLVFSLKKAEIEDELLVIAGDNLFKFDLQELVEFFNTKKASCVALHTMTKEHELGLEYGVAQIDKNNKITHFEEKPKKPKSDLVSTGCYVFSKGDFPKIIKFSKNKNIQQIGELIKYISGDSSVYGIIFDEPWFDIGSFEALEFTNKLYSKHDKSNT